MTPTIDYLQRLRALGREIGCDVTTHHRPPHCLWQLGTDQNLTRRDFSADHPVIELTRASRRVFVVPGRTFRGVIVVDERPVESFNNYTINHIRSEVDPSAPRPTITEVVE